MSQSTRQQIRWWFRVLCEPAFLRLYLDDQQVLPLRLMEDAFWHLSPDSERPAGERHTAWDVLRQWLDPPEDTLPFSSPAPPLPIDWFSHALVGLRGLARQSQDIADLSRFWSLPELFPCMTRSSGDADVIPDPGYHEIHCHFRGAVPYLHLWRGWLDNLRWRARLSRESCAAGPWQKTWAELVDRAHEEEKILRGSVPGAVNDSLSDAMRESDRLRQIADLAAGEGPSHAGRDAASLRRSAARYLAICTGLHVHLIHQRGKSGLSPFVTAYGRYSRLQKIGSSRQSRATQKQVHCILRRFEDDGAVAVELRPTLERRRRELQIKLGGLVRGYFDYLIDWLRRADEQSGHSPRPVLMGLVPSLFKQDGLREGPTDIAQALLWERQADLWRHQIEMLLSVLRDVPALRYFVVGVDAAGKERGCPPRVLAPAYELLREHNVSHGVSRARPGRRMSAEFLCELVRRALAAVHDDHARAPQAAFEALGREPVPVIRLGITLHAGEDFLDPHTGLRHTWESMEALSLGPGDRIGHALAAAFTPDVLQRWLERRSRGAGDITRRADDTFMARIPRGTHLLDLAWRWHMHEHEDHGDYLGARLAYAMSSAFGNPAPAARIAAALADAGPACALPLPAVRFADPRHLPVDDHVTVIWDKAWCQRFEKLRRSVLAEIVRRGVVIESCPSSNMVVADLERPPIIDLIEHDRLRCAMATDDPGIFGAWPRDELARVAASNDTEHAPGETNDSSSGGSSMRDRLLQEAERASFIWGT